MLAHKASKTTFALLVGETECLWVGPASLRASERGEAPGQAFLTLVVFLDVRMVSAHAGRVLSQQSWFPWTKVNNEFQKVDKTYLKLATKSSQKL